MQRLRVGEGAMEGDDIPTGGTLALVAERD